MKRVRYIGLILLMLSILCACSKQEAVSSIHLPDADQAEESTIGKQGAAAPTVSAGTTWKEESDGVYHLEYETLPLPEAIGSATAQTVLADAILVGGQTSDGVALARLTPDGESEAIPLPDGTEYLYALCPDDAGGFWLLHGSLPAAYCDSLGNFIIMDDDPEGNLFITHYDADFSMQESIALQTAYTGNNERFKQLLKTDGGFCLLSASLLVKIDETGAETARQTAGIEDGWVFEAMQELDGTLFVLTQCIFGGALPELCRFDAAALTPQDAIQDETAITGLGRCGDGRLLLGSKDAVFAYTPESGEKAPLFSWQAFGVTNTAEQLWQTEAGFFFYSSNMEKLELLRWIPGEAPVRTSLTLAIVSDCGISYALTQMIQDFNLSQNQWRVDDTVYSDSGFSDGQPLDLLRTQIMAGQAPDLYAFYTDGHTASPLAADAVCADLLPLLGGEITRDCLVPGLYALLTQDGSLYQLPLTIVVDTLIAPSRLIPQPGVTLAELEQARASIADGWVPIDSWNTPENLFALCTPFCIGAYVDRENGTCSFETQGFYDYLTWCKTWGGDGSTPAEPEQTLVRLSWISTLRQLAGRSESAETVWFGEPGYTYAGFPTESGSGSAYRILSSLGISPQCRDPEGAKAFLLFCFSYLQEDALPANYALLRSEMDAYMEGKRTDWRGEITRISESDAKQFYDLLDTITLLEGLDEPLAEIMGEEAAAYFAGDCSAEQAAKNIQSRATLYLQEQYG